MSKGLFNEGGSKAISLDDLQDGMSAEDLNASPQVEQENPAETVAEEQPVVEKPVETKAEESTPQPTKVAEEKTEKEKPQEEPSNQFDFAFFNKTLNTNYESFDQIKADISKPTMEPEYKDVSKQLEEWQAKYNDLNETYELLTEQLDPSTYFSSDDAMKLEAFKKENSDKDASVAQKVFMTEDLSSIDDIDIVKMGWRFNTPNLKGTDRDLEMAIAEELNQDPDTLVNEWPVTAQNRLARMASEYANQFKQIKSSVTLPEKVNIEALKAQRKQSDEQRQAELIDGWSKVADETLSNTEGVKLPIGKPNEGEEQQYFVWELGEAPKEEVDSLKEKFVMMGIDPIEEKESFKETLNLALIQKNLPQIMQKYGDDLLARIEEKHLEETHNPTPLKDSERTDISEADKEKAEQTRFAINDVVPRFRTNPLFTKK